MKVVMTSHDLTDKGRGVFLQHIVAELQSRAKMTNSVDDVYHFNSSEEKLFVPHTS